MCAVLHQIIFSCFEYPQNPNVEAAKIYLTHFPSPKNPQIKKLISDLKKFFVHPYDFTLEYLPWLKNPTP